MSNLPTLIIGAMMIYDREDRCSAAGGHLAVLAQTDWQKHFGILPTFLRGVCGISGLYDLKPFPFTALQPYLQLTWDQVARNSPILHVRDRMPPGGP